MTFGSRVYGVGVMTLAMVCLAWGNFDPGQPVPRDFPGRTALAYAAASFMLVAGAAVEWPRTAAWGGAALTAYYAFIVVIVMNGRLVLAHHSEFGTYSGVAEQLAIAAGGLIIYATSAKVEAARAARLTRLGQLATARMPTWPAEILDPGPLQRRVPGLRAHLTDRLATKAEDQLQVLAILPLYYCHRRRRLVWGA